MAFVEMVRSASTAGIVHTQNINDYFSEYCEYLRISVSNCILRKN